VDGATAPAPARSSSNLKPWPGVSSPWGFTDSGKQTSIFVANDGVTGFELWALPRAAVEGALDFYTLPPCRVFDTLGGAPLAAGVGPQLRRGRQLRASPPPPRWWPPT